MENICPKCGAKNSLFTCSMGAVNCSACCEYIGRANKDDKLEDVEEDVKSTFKTHPVSAGHTARHDPEEFERITKEHNN